MAISALLGSIRPPEPFASSMPIGEPDRNIFSCPVCSRPLATGAGRCPGCKTRLAMGVPLKRASLFVSTGLLVGLFAGGGLMAAAGGVAGGALPTPSQPAGGVLPSASTTPSASLAPTPTRPPVDPGIPPSSRAALGQVGTLEIRLLEAADDLRTHLAATDLDTSAVAQTLRSLNSNAAFGIDVARRLGDWDAGARLAEDLAALCEDIRSTARSGLSASVRNDAAYRTAATEMLALLGTLGSLDADARSLALIADVDFPRVDLGEPDGAATTP